MRPEPIPPGPNQESVWDYPRPPRVEAVTKRIRIIFNQQLIVDTRRSKRILETSHPPNYYIPLDDIKTEYLKPSDRTSYCEWKGQAHYYSLQVGDRQAKDVAWYYPQISPSYVALDRACGILSWADGRLLRRGRKGGAAGRKLLCWVDYSRYCWPF